MHSDTHLMQINLSQISFSFYLFVPALNNAYLHYLKKKQPVQKQNMHYWSEYTFENTPSPGYPHTTT